MVTTRSSQRGAPLKAAGAYNPDAYFAEKDQGYGDVGVDQVDHAIRVHVDVHACARACVMVSHITAPPPPHHHTHTHTHTTPPYAVCCCRCRSLMLQ